MEHITEEQLKEFRELQYICTLASPPCSRDKERIVYIYQSSFEIKGVPFKTFNEHLKNLRFKIAKSHKFIVLLN